MTEKVSLQPGKSAPAQTNAGLSRLEWRRLLVSLAILCTLLAIAVLSRAQPELPRRSFDGFGIDPGWVPTVARPASHDDPEWMRRHGLTEAWDSATPCTNCHTQESCATCHAGENTASSAHPAGWLLMHGTGSMSSCNSCHSTTRFCRDCHTDAAIVGQSGYRPSPWVSVHSSDWIQGADGGRHAREARLELGSCASCHGGNDCVQCHISASPHGSSFDERCAPLLRAGEPTCATCHGGSVTLPMEILHQRCR